MSYHDREGAFWGGYNVSTHFRHNHYFHHANATGKEEGKANDPNEDKPNSHSHDHRRIFKQLKRWDQFLNPSKKSDNSPASPPSLPEAPGDPESSEHLSRQDREDGVRTPPDLPSNAIRTLGPFQRSPTPSWPSAHRHDHLVSW
ncbi:hypothetical protein PAXINDRAFT_20724 [Paxillus involutus ATCC 200175]|uniref:Uncharacterized protein n=1 Tax=Paxillus involutus ATCC 200175 TaxID=664439 RepID=A0A0C9T3K4_PAXIN|nr:hypothetical protein PAXINDRAFT_20724 [Paxillus involutus ATCC 200175]